MYSQFIISLFFIFQVSWTQMVSRLSGRKKWKNCQKWRRNCKILQKKFYWVLTWVMEYWHTWVQFNTDLFWDAREYLYAAYWLDAKLDKNGKLKRMIKSCGQVITFVDESRKSGRGSFGGEVWEMLYEIFMLMPKTFFKDFWHL